MAWADVAMATATTATAINLIISFSHIRVLSGMPINRFAVIASRQPALSER
jgi:hypothetical protein